jgi:hypothetical protein
MGSHTQTGWANRVMSSNSGLRMSDGEWTANLRDCLPDSKYLLLCPMEKQCCRSLMGSKQAIRRCAVKFTYE